MTIKNIGIQIEKYPQKIAIKRENEEQNIVLFLNVTKEACAVI